MVLRTSGPDQHQTGGMDGGLWSLVRALVNGDGQESITFMYLFNFQG